MSYRLARSLDRLRSEVNAEWPNRSKASDGWIGDAAHRSRPSDHNPNVHGVVQALDLTAPEGHEVMERIRRSRDRRVKYMISNGRICSAYDHVAGPAWSWRTYSGSNKHTRHAHISVADAPSLYDDNSPWFEEDDMALTDKQQADLHFAGQLRAAVEGANSNATAIKYMIDHLRNHPSSGGGLSEAEVRRIATEVVRQIRLP